MKKLSVLAGMLLAGAMILVSPATVKAEGMPCTEATLQQFQANLAVARQELATAQANKAQADAKVAALRAQGIEGLELLQATDAATNAANIVSAYQHKVNGAEASVNNIASRGRTEQYYLDMEEKWRNRASLDSIQVQLTGANQITSAALTQLKNLQGELLKAQVNAAGNPGLACNVDLIAAQVNAAEATYLTAKANSDALTAQYAQALGVPNFATDADNAAYDAFVRNYATALRQEYVYSSKDADGNEVDKTKLYYPDYNKNSDKGTGSYYGNGIYNYPQPNEWSIRWFE